MHWGDIGMDVDKELALGVFHHHISREALEKLLKLGMLSEDEFKRADGYLYERYKVDKSIAYNHSLQYAPNEIEESGITQTTISDECEYLSLTDIARKHDEDKPGYVIQSWLRNRNTLEFLNLWEQENNPDYNTQGYDDLKLKALEASFTVTPKQWIEQTGAIGVKSKQGKNGGTYAHATIACEFLMWLSPKYKLDFLEMRKFSKDNGLF